MLKQILEKIDSKDGIYTPKKIKFDKFGKIIKKGNFEGFVFLGAGGTLDEWVKGIPNLLQQKGVVDSANPEETFMGAYELTTTGGRTDLALVFNTKKAGLDIGKLAMWRLKFGSTSWISDYLNNYKSQH